MNKKIIGILLSLLCGFLVNSSFSQGCYVTSKKDTVVCSNVDFTTNSRGFITELSYSDKNGKTVILKKRKNIPIIISIYAAGIQYDRMPLKTNKPTGYHRFGKRIVNGKLSVSVYNDLETKRVYYTPSVYNPKGAFKNETSGTYLFQLKMIDGKIIKINKKNMKKIIKPYLLQCKQFASEYKGNFAHDEASVIEMITFYNNLCK